MKLFYANASPFVRVVMIALHETGLLSQVDLIDVAVTPTGPEGALHGANPLGKIPCLIREDDSALFDSRVICRFLAAQRPDAGLYPDGDDLWAALTLEALAMGIMEAAVLMVYEGRLRPEVQQSPEWIDAQWGKVDRALRTLETSWMPTLDARPNIAVLAVAAALGYLDFRHDARGWKKTYPALARWAAGISDRPSLKATGPV